MSKAVRVWFVAVLSLGACTNREPTSTASGATDVAASWWQWHDEKRAVDRAVDQAINEPNGGDYAKAADAIRNSSFPPAVKQFQIGQVVVDAYVERSPKRPPETVEQGVRMMEDASIAPGKKSEANDQYLRMLFERGGGTPPTIFPKDPEVAACWLAVEREQSNDRARCIALRRQRLPNIGS